MGTSTHDADVIVIGAGLAGLTAARHLHETGRRVLVVDKGRSVGGRMATRRIGEARLDHGAQFFTVRGEAFRAVVDEAVAADVVHVWNRGFSDAGDGYPRFVGTEGMNSVAKWLAASLVEQGVTISLQTQLQSIAVDDTGWQLRTEDQTLRAPAIIATPPVPQTLALLDAGGVTLPAAADGQLRAVEYHPVFALLVTLDGEPRVHASGGEQHTDGPFSFVGNNHHKTISPSPAVTFHASHEWSKVHFDSDADEVHAKLLELAQPWFGDAKVVDSQVQRWRFAGPVSVVPEPAIVVEVNGHRCAFAGDAFAGPKIEGAFNSGRAAALLVPGD